MAALLRIDKNSFFVNARNTDRGASNLTIAEREKILVRNLMA